MFNRPDLVKQTFPKIKEMKPKYLFLASDGPRKENKEDLQKCAECRKWVLAQIDWDCEIQTLFQDENLGCGLAVSGAITWFFEHVEMGIILEDDCIAEISFFSYAQQILTKYKKVKSIYGVTGLNWQDGKNRGSNSYYFSSFPGIWGWGTWKDRWQKFVLHPNDVKGFIKSKVFNQHLENPHFKKILIDGFNQIGTNDSWGYSWRLAVFKEQGKIVVPNVNLITNIGFSSEGTHTKFQNDRFGSVSTDSIKFPLKHPNTIEINKEADFYQLNRHFTKKTFLQKLKNLFIKLYHMLFLIIL